MRYLCLLIFSGCTLFSKNGGDDEMEKLGKDVLKAKEGLEITIEPLQSKK